MKIPPKGYMINMWLNIYFPLLTTHHHYVSLFYRRYSHLLMFEGVTIKICRIVMVSTNKYYPVVCFVHAFDIPFHHILVAFFLFKAKATFLK